MRTDHRGRLGDLGEELAARHLAGLGLTILERKVRCKRGEIDIVAHDGRQHVFVEVKTRSTPLMGVAAEGVDSRKAARLEKAILEYVHLHNLHERPMRIDVVAVDFQGDVPRIEHFPAAITWR